MIKKIAAIFISLLLGCQPVREERPKMHTVKERVETHCLGRHVISIPESFNMVPVVTGIFRAQGAGLKDPAFDISVQFDGVTKSKFDALVQARRVELSESDGESMKILRLDKALSDTSTLFRVQEIGESYFSEFYLLRGGAFIKVRLDSFRNGFVEAERKISELTKEIRVYDSSANSNLTGFCFGPVTLNSKFSKEYANYIFRDAKGLKLEVEIDTYSHDQPDSLLAKMSGGDSLLKKFKINHTVLRARNRTVADMQAEEWMGVGYLGQAEQRTLKFTLETKRAIPSMYRPILSITFDSAQPLRDGTQTMTEISNEEAVELWDDIVDSVKFYHK